MADENNSMILKVVADDHVITLQVPRDFMAEADGFFKRMDADMDAGWQMGRDWVSAPDRRQRCQIAADRLYTALRNENQAMIGLMAGYILRSLPGVSEVHVNVEGEPGETGFVAAGSSDF